jgi:hypothetical protein
MGVVLGFEGFAEDPLPKFWFDFQLLKTMKNLCMFHMHARWILGGNNDLCFWNNTLGKHIITQRNEEWWLVVLGSTNSLVGTTIYALEQYPRQTCYHPTEWQLVVPGSTNSLVE